MDEVSSQVMPPDSQELLGSQDYPCTQQPANEPEDVNDENERTILYEATMKRLDRENHKCCIAALQYIRDFAILDFQQVIAYIENNGKPKTRHHKKSPPYHDQQNIPLYEVLALLHWVEQKTE